MADLTIEQAVKAVQDSNALLKSDIEAKYKQELDAMKAKDAEIQASIEEEKKKAALHGATIGDLVEITKEMNVKLGRGFQSTSTNKTKREEVYVPIIQKMLSDNIENLEKAGEGQKLEMMQKVRLVMEGTKASAVSSASMATFPYVQFLPWQPGMEPIGQYRIRTLLGTIPSDFDIVHFPRANVPVGAGSFSNQTTEGNAKDQVDRGYTMIEVTLLTKAAYIICSRQSLRNIPFLMTWLPTSLNEQLLDTEDRDFANALVAGATGSATGVTVGTTINVEAITILIKNLIKNKFYPNAVALDPDVWQKILVTKAVTSGQYSLPVGSVAINPAGDVTILGRPLLPVNWLTGGRCLIGDYSKASIVESSALQFLQTDSHASTFIANQLTFLLERTEGLAIFRPDAFVTALLTAAT